VTETVACPLPELAVAEVPLTRPPLPALNPAPSPLPPCPPAAYAELVAEFAPVAVAEALVPVAFPPAPPEAPLPPVPGAPALPPPPPLAFAAAVAVPDEGAVVPTVAVALPPAAPAPAEPPRG
jgi:hypothetical protein